MPTVIPDNWEFIKWRGDDAIVYVPNERFRLRSIHKRANPFYAAILAAHGPIHEPTPEQLAREAEIHRAGRKVANKQALTIALRGVSNFVDNPSHWGRLSPEIKSAMQTHYRELLKVREHEDFDGANHIDSFYGGDAIPAMPKHDTLEDQDSTPHREYPFLLPANTPLMRGDVLARMSTKHDKHTRAHYGAPATIANTLLDNNFDLFLATNKFVETPDTETFAIASERGLVKGFPVSDAANISDRICFLPSSGELGERLTLNLKHPHGWPDCGFTVSHVNDDATVDFWWDGPVSYTHLTLPTIYSV